MNHNDHAPNDTADPAGTHFGVNKPNRHALKMWWPYKVGALVVVFLVAAANCLMELGTIADFTGSPDLEFTHGVRASIFALVAASALFITSLPKNQAVQDEMLDHLCRAVSVAAGFLTGLFWLLEETRGNAGPFIVVVLAVAGFLAVFLVLALVIQLIIEWARRRKSGHQ